MIYTIAATRKDLSKNLGLELDVSSASEAMTRYHSFGGPVGHDSADGFDASVWVKLPSGELQEIECEDFSRQPIGHVSDDEFACPECGEEKGIGWKFCAFCGEEF